MLDTEDNKHPREYYRIQHETDYKQPNLNTGKMHEFLLNKSGSIFTQSAENVGGYIYAFTTYLIEGTAVRVQSRDDYFFTHLKIESTTSDKGPLEAVVHELTAEFPGLEVDKHPPNE